MPVVKKRVSFAVEHHSSTSSTKTTSQPLQAYQNISTNNPADSGLSSATPPSYSPDRKKHKLPPLTPTNCCCSCACRQRSNSQYQYNNIVNMMDDSNHSDGMPPIPTLKAGTPNGSPRHHGSAPSSRRGCCGWFSDLSRELVMSTELLFYNKLNWLLLLGPLALAGDATGFLGEAACFTFSGIALIPCAERLSFVTEQVAEHTNGTIGALLNATFGNAPELLIATAALRSGFYRVVQLAMLGSMLTNLLFVFGISCLIGGLRWQVQELRITSGNVSVGMLLLSTAGSLLPATLILSGQLKQSGESTATNMDTSANAIAPPSLEELQLSRVNAFVLIFMYGCYLIFQLGTHKEEFDEEDNIVQTASDHEMHLSPHFTSRHGRQSKARRNLFCLGMFRRTLAMRMCNSCSGSTARMDGDGWIASPGLLGSGSGSGDVEMAAKNSDDDRDNVLRLGNGVTSDEDYDGSDDDDSDTSSEDGNVLLPQNEALRNDTNGNDYFDDYTQELPSPGMRHLSSDISANDDSAARQRRNGGSVGSNNYQSSLNGLSPASLSRTTRGKKKKSKKKNKSVPQRPLLPLGLADPGDDLRTPPTISRVVAPAGIHRPREEAQMSFRAGILWLFIITLGISAMSDILVDTIDGFAHRLHISEVFTSMVIVPFFSNVAEQVSAVLFAYRNEMDLCVGVTVGSAIQVASFVLPGCVIIGWLVDRSMTLYFHAYETVCLFLGVVVIAAILQGGTTNWLVGATCISVYIMIATGFWFHSLEDLAVDAESIGNNATRF